VSGTFCLKRVLRNGAKSVLSAVSGGKADMYVNAGDKITFGGRHVSVRATPGHTNGCATYVLDNEAAAFTGDALLIRGCGRTDFQQGDSGRLFESIRTQIFTLPDSCVIFPGHDYKGHTSSTVAEEKMFNPRLGLSKSKEEFVAIMANLNLPLPKFIGAAPFESALTTQTSPCPRT
jgi:sulfur dioxygenase